MRLAPARRSQLAGALTITVQLVDSITRYQVAAFQGKARNNDLGNWLHSDVGFFSASNRNGLRFQNWMITHESRLPLIKQFVVIVEAPAAPPPATCPDDTVCSECTVSAWSAYGACSDACGGGLSTRSRTITAGADLPCSLDLTESQTCNLQACEAVEPLNAVRAVVQARVFANRQLAVCCAEAKGQGKAAAGRAASAAAQVEHQGEQV